MGEAFYLVIGGLKHEHALIFASLSVLLQVFVPYHRYAPVLKFLTLVLFFLCRGGFYGRDSVAACAGRDSATDHLAESRLSPHDRRRPWHDPWPLSLLLASLAGG